jgi:hypothetical protein
MIRFLLFILMNFLLFESFAQDITDMFNFGGSFQDQLHGYASDSEGNTYILASNNGMIYYGDLNIPSTFGSGVFTYIMKIDPQGNYLWHQTLDCSNTNMLRGRRMIVDADQNIYVTLPYAGDANIQGYVLPPTVGNFGKFTAKFDSLGQIQWLINAGGKSLCFADDNTICLFEYESPDGMIGSETITNYEGCVYKMDLDGVYQGHVHIDIQEYTSEVISGLNSDGAFYGYRIGPPSGTSAVLEMFSLAADGSVAQSQVINYLYLYDEPSPLVHDASTGHYFMTGKFRNRTPFDSPTGIMQSSLMLIHLDADFNLLSTLELGPALTTNGGSPEFHMQAVDGYLYLCGVILTAPYTFWTSLGQQVYLYPEQHKPIFAKLNGNLQIMWYRAFPSFYSSSRIYPNIHNGLVQLVANLPELEMDGFSNIPMGLHDISIVTFDDSNTNVSSASGIVYVDANTNGVFDEGELPATGIHVTNSLLPGMHFYSDSNGLYQMPLAAGSQQITIDGLPIYWFHTSSASIDIIAEEGTTAIDNLNFGISPLPDIQDLSVTISSVNFPNVAANVYYTVDLCNYGTTTQSGNLTLLLDNPVTYLSSAPEALQSGDTLFLPYTNLLSGECLQFTIQGSLPADVSLLNTHLFSYIYTSSSVNDSTPFNNIDSLQQMIIGPYDPNNISVIPECAISEPFINTNQSLDYIIRFQNLGSDTAIDVTVRAPLSPFLNASAFQFISSSHPCSFEIINDEIIIVFDNINLPEATVNEYASQGYFRFSMPPASSIVNASIIEESAAIFFDFNPPVITNTVHTEYLDPEFMVERLITHASCPAAADASLQITSVCPDASMSYSLDNGPFTPLTSANITSLEVGTYHLIIQQYGSTLIEEDLVITALAEVALELLQANGSCTYASDGNFEISLPCVNAPYELRIDDGPVLSTSETLFSGLNPGTHRLVVYIEGDSLVLENITIDAIAPVNFTNLEVPSLDCMQDSGMVVINNDCIGSATFSYSIDNGTVLTSPLGESITVPSGWHELFAYTETDMIYDGEYVITFNSFADTTVTVQNTVLIAGSASPGTTYQWYDCSTGTAIDNATSAAYYPVASGSYYFVAMTAEECEYQSSCHAITISGVENREIGLSRVYPNPAVGPVTIEWSNIGNEVTIQITTMRGQVIEEVLLKGKSRYTTLLTASGIYNVLISGNKAQECHQVIID